MGIFDQAKQFADKHADKIEQGIDKAGDFIDSKTAGQHADKVDKAQDFLKDKIGPQDTTDPGVPPAQTPPPVPPQH